MLRKPDVGTERILALADFLDQLEPERFSMNSWGLHDEPRCICGWYQQLHGNFDKMDAAQAAEGMGLSRPIAARLFGDTAGAHTPQQAAKKLRYLAVTGELP